MGFDEEVLIWIEKWLVNGTKSMLFHVTLGVPPRSVSGSLYFSVLITCLFACDSLCCLYADDTLLGGVWTWCTSKNNTALYYWFIHWGWL